VAGLSNAVDRAIQAQARELLAADLAVESRRPIPGQVLTAIDGIAGSRRAGVLELPSVVSNPAASQGTDAPGPSLLCELKAVEPGYPFYGSLETDPEGTIEQLLDRDRLLVAPEALTRLGTAVGGSLRVGDADFTIAGVITAEPDRLAVSFTLGPRVLLSQEGLERTGLVGMGSRVRHRVLVRLADGSTTDDVALARSVIGTAIPDPEFVDVESYVEAQPSLRTGLGRVERFLGLVALLSLLIGGIGVAQAVRAWLAGRLDAIAVLRAIGVRPHEVFVLYLGQTVVLALVGSAAGAVAGALAAQAVRGIGLGVGVALLFGLRPLFDVVRVPPVRVLRRDVDPLPVRRGIAAAMWAVLLIGIGATAAVQSGSVLRGAQFAAGLIGATAALVLGAWVVIRAVGRTPRETGSVALRHGLAALGRPGSGTLGAVVALGLGVVTVLGMYLIEDRLSAQLDAELPDEAPSAFLIDIQPDQWPGVRAVLEEADAEDVDSVEVVAGRLRSVAGVPVADLVQERGRDRRWVLTREQRLSTMESLPEDNVIVDGALWSYPDRPEVSVEQEYAADLGVGVGDSLVFDIQGVPLELLVTSIRTVDWTRFTINFFLVVEPGVLDEAPRTRIAATRIPEASESTLQDRLAASFPNVTMLRLRQLLDQVVGILLQVGLAIRMLGAFTVLAGIAILAGAISAGAVRRGRAVALYKTLGMTRAQVAAVFAVEYALVGLVAGGIGTVGGIVLSWAVTRFGFEIAWAWTPAAYLVALISTVALSVVAGLSASVRALAVRPLAILRQGD
jgi:putative ABC transport system permease protein